jgi:inorganic pyrophosphatase
MGPRPLTRLPASPQEGLIHVVVESPAGSTTKIKYEPELDLFMMSRPLPLGVLYPHDWGFVPGTRAEDGDPVDVLMLSEGTTFPGLLVRARPLGVIRLEQNRRSGGGRERNDRIVAAAEKAPRRELSTAADLPERERQEIEQFFLSATFFESKDAVILGWGGPDEVWKLLRASGAG